MSDVVSVVKSVRPTKSRRDGGPSHVIESQRVLKKGFGAFEQDDQTGVDLKTRRAKEWLKMNWWIAVSICAVFADSLVVLDQVQLYTGIDESVSRW